MGGMAEMAGGLSRAKQNEQNKIKIPIHDITGQAITFLKKMMKEVRKNDSPILPHELNWPEDRAMNGMMALCVDWTI